MAILALVDIKRVNVVESRQQLTLPAGEIIGAHKAVRIDPATGRFIKAGASTAAKARIYGITTRAARVGEAVTVIRVGVTDGVELGALGYDADVFLSDTDGELADVAGTISVKVGRVLPATATVLGQAYDKLLFIDL